MSDIAQIIQSCLCPLISKTCSVTVVLIINACNSYCYYALQVHNVLDWLNLNNTDLSDIRALEGMPVRDLKLAGTKITNSQVLKGLRYHSLVIPENFKELEFIRARQKYYIYRKNKRKLTRWVMINGLPANEFLEKYYSKN